MLSDCPCFSGLPYLECCGPFHAGDKDPDNALQLMRSRFSAYALEKPDYIISTTHPESPLYRKDKVKWREEILEFCKNTEFLGLKILEFSDGPESSTVRFKALLTYNGRDASFEENSVFLKSQSHGRWLYRSQ